MDSTEALELGVEDTSGSSSFLKIPSLNPETERRRMAFKEQQDGPLTILGLNEKERAHTHLYTCTYTHMNTYTHTYHLAFPFCYNLIQSQEKQQKQKK